MRISKWSNLWRVSAVKNTSQSLGKWMMWRLWFHHPIWVQLISWPRTYCTVIKASSAMVTMSHRHECCPRWMMMIKVNIEVHHLVSDEQLIRSWLVNQIHRLIISLKCEVHLNNDNTRMGVMAHIGPRDRSLTDLSISCRRKPNISVPNKNYLKLSMMVKIHWQVNI